MSGELLSLCNEQQFAEDEETSNRRCEECVEVRGSVGEQVRRGGSEAGREGAKTKRKKWNENRTVDLELVGSTP